MNHSLTVCRHSGRPFFAVDPANNGAIGIEDYAKKQAGIMAVFPLKCRNIGQYHVLLVHEAEKWYNDVN